MDKEDLYEQNNEDPSLRIDKKKLKNDSSHYGREQPANDLDIRITKEQTKRHQIERQQHFSSDPEAIQRARHARVEAKYLENEAEIVRREKQRLADLKPKWVMSEEARIAMLAEIEARKRSERSQLELEQRRAAYTGNGWGCMLPVVFVAAFFALLVLITQLI